jgi:hypothetical protein
MGQKRQLDEVCEGADPLRSWRCCGLDLLALGSSVFILRGRLEPSSGPLHDPCCALNFLPVSFPLM